MNLVTDYHEVEMSLCIIIFFIAKMMLQESMNIAFNLWHEFSVHACRVRTVIDTLYYVVYSVYGTGLCIVKESFSLCMDLIVSG